MKIFVLSATTIIVLLLLFVAAGWAHPGGDHPDQHQHQHQAEAARAFGVRRALGGMFPLGRFRHRRTIGFGIGPYGLGIRIGTPYYRPYGYGGYGTGFGMPGYGYGGGFGGFGGYRPFGILG